VRLGVEAALIDGQLVPGDVEVLGGRVAGFGLSSPNGHGIAAPGFVDLQVNGFGGVDFLSADIEGYRQAGEALLETGVTAYLPTFITSPEEQLLAALREVPSGGDGPRVLGAHLEGPSCLPCVWASIRRMHAGTRTSTCSIDCSTRGPSDSSRSHRSCPVRRRSSNGCCNARSPSPAAIRTRVPSRRMRPSTSACGA